MMAVESPQPPEIKFYAALSESETGVPRVVWTPQGELQIYPVAHSGFVFIVTPESWRRLNGVVEAAVAEQDKP